MTTPLLKAAALHQGDTFHLLDHIAPLADLFSIPLITTEEKSFRLAKLHYPHVHIEYEENLEFKLGSLAEKFDLLFQCQYWLPQLKTIFRELYHKEVKLIFCPHGQSDKGRNSPILSLYQEQEFVLLYGKLLIQMLKQLKVWPSISNYALIGNYRLSHYLRHKKFYDDLVEKEIFSHLSQGPTLLYAPTWQDKDQSTSFFYGAPKLFSELPSHWNLVVKVHPRLEEKDPARFYPLLRLAEKRANLFIITEFPSVYPILNKVDAYLGDFSSVGYDFLAFRRPMFFFSHPSLSPSRLQSCGPVLQTKSNIFSMIEKNMNLYFKNEQEKLYQLAFGKTKSDEMVRKTILSAIQSRY
jgi:hypothetical protein